MKKFFSMILLLAFTVPAVGQEAKPQTFTTARDWRPDPTYPDGGHQVHFYDHAKMRTARGVTVVMKAEALPPAPATFDYGAKITYPMFGNDSKGDCFYASACHHDQTLTGNWTAQSTFNVATILSRYKTLSGGDNGLSDSDILGEWTKRYLADVKEAKIIDKFYVDVTDPQALQSACYWFGGCQFTFTVAKSWIDNSGTGAVWESSTYRANNNGHAVHFAGFDAKGNAKLVTWGTYVWITSGAIKVCNPSGFAVFSVRWFDPKTGRAPNGKHVTELAKIWQDATGRAILAAVVNSFPPAGVDPPIPVPVPPAKGGTITIRIPGQPDKVYEINEPGTKAKQDEVDALILDFQKRLDDIKKKKTSSLNHGGKQMNVATTALLATAMLGQPQSTQSEYDVARQRAIDQNKTLFVFVGCKAQKLPSFAIGVEVPGLKGYRAPCIVEALPENGNIYFNRQFPATWKVMVEPIAASPFSVVPPSGGASGKSSVGRDDSDLAAGPWPKCFPKPDGLVQYKPAQYTQALSRVGSFSRDAWHIEPVHRSRLERRWQVPGGMEGVDGWRSDLYKSVRDVRTGKDYLPVFNGANDQYEWGHVRTYGDGSLFADVLSNTETGSVFEIRYAEKTNGRWDRYVAYQNPFARPHGYARVSSRRCVECHSMTGSGGYSVGLVPGGDGVISDPFPGLE